VSATLPLVTFPLLCVAACDAQVGDEYRGEPLLSMQGTVVLSEPNDPRNVVPAIAFAAEFQTVLIEPEVRGQFPAQFRLDITEPPPAEALFELPDSDGGKLALGRIVVLPRQHGQRIPERIPALVTKEDSVHDHTNDWTEYTRVLEKCTAAGACLKRTLACKLEPCELVESTTPEKITRAHETSMITCGIDTCMTLNISCDAAERCEREVHHCDISELEPFSSANSGAEIHRCAVLSETGDSSIERLERLEEVAIGYYVFYFSKPTEFGRLGTVPAGYHLAKFTKATKQDWLAHITCVSDASILALDQYIQEHGLDRIDPALNDADREAISKLEDELAQNCPTDGSWELISDPLAQPLTLVIGRDPTVP
jgi:hypothetical protein